MEFAFLCRAAYRPQHRARNPNEITTPFPPDRAFACYQFIECCVLPAGVALLDWLLVLHEPLEMAGWRWVALIG